MYFPPRKDINTPEESELNFLYCLGYQNTNDSLLNFIASELNTIPDIHSRTLKVYDWTSAIKWLLEKVNRYDNCVFPYFFGEFFNTDYTFDYQFENLGKTIVFLDNVKNLEDIQMVGDKEFTSVKIPEVVRIQESKPNLMTKTEFSDYDLNEQQNILNIYKWYKKELDFQTSLPFFPERDDELISDVITAMVHNKMGEDLNTEENLAIVDEVCCKFIEAKANNSKNTISENEIIKLINNQISVNENLIIVAYYLYYILVSLGVVPDEKTSSGIFKFSWGKGAVLQRLLCAVTTKRWDGVEQKSNTYYQALYKMFKFSDIKDELEKEKMLKHLGAAKRMLTDGGFDNAISLISEDMNLISNL
ncbi:MAG: hypothetical protein JZU53_04850 [Paludibacter sp.]|nr:hypothetical protein [Paludibacter sp.]